jgi:hypothetical protein
LYGDKYLEHLYEDLYNTHIAKYNKFLQEGNSTNNLLHEYDKNENTGKENLLNDLVKTSCK